MRNEVKAYAALLAVLIVGMMLKACAHAPPPTRVVCLPVAPYTQAQQTRLADELAAQPAGSMLATAVVDYGRLRAAARACDH